MHTCIHYDYIAMSFNFKSSEILFPLDIHIVFIVV